MFKQHVKTLAKYTNMIKVDDNFITLPHDHKIEFDKLKIYNIVYVDCVTTYIRAGSHCKECYMNIYEIHIREYKCNNILELSVVLCYDGKNISNTYTRIYPNVIKINKETRLFRNEQFSSSCQYIYGDLYKYTPFGKTYSLNRVKYNNFIEMKNIIIKQFNDILLPELLNIILDYMLQDVKLMI
jgi:hypothetical protein